MNKLDEIQGNWEYERCIKPECVEWLIEQAERVEELEQKANDWRDEAIKWNIRFRESEESHLETKELLYSTISENKRYKQALENITISPIPLEIDNAVNIARQALEGDDE